VRRQSVAITSSAIGTAAATAIIGSALSSFVRTVGADVSDFVAVEASLRPLFARFGTIAAQMSVGSAVVATLSTTVLLRFVAVTAQVALRATVVALSGVQTALSPRLLAVAADVTVAAAVVTVLTSLSTTERAIVITGETAVSVVTAATALVTIT